MKGTLATVHKFLSTIISLAVFVQFFLAGIWHAHVVSSPDAHVMMGLGMLLASLLALLAAIGGRLGRRVIVITAVLFVLILLQPILIEQRRSGIPFVSAFHTLNAAFIGMVAGAVSRISQGAPQVEEAGVLQPATGD
jgi:high-affinity Fe2+/Pb2+ permease